MVGLWLSMQLAVGDSGVPLYGYRFGHFENISDPDRSAQSIERHLQQAGALGIPMEAYLHRGEHQAAVFARSAPGLLQSLRDPSVTLAYHPHGVHPFSDLIVPLRDQEWSEAVAGFERLERCAIDYTTATVDCTRPGGAAALAEIIGRPISAVAYQGLDAVATYVYHHLLGVPARGDSKARMVRFSGDPVDLYWYMGALVISVLPEARVEGYSEPSALAVLRTLPGPGPRMCSLLATDKVERHDTNKLIDRRYRPGISTFDQVRPRDDELAHPRKVARYWELQEEALAEADRLVRDSGGQWVTSASLMTMLADPSELLSAEHLDRAAAAFRPELPSVELDIGDRSISLADAYAGLRLALLSWSASGTVPRSVKTDGVLGPIFDPLRGPPPIGAPAARAPLPLSVLLEGLAAVPPDRVAASLPAGPGQDPLNPVEQLAAMASAYQSIRAGSPPESIARLPEAPWPVPGGVRGGQRTDLDRWDWYTRLQHWTTKRARWK